VVSFDGVDVAYRCAGDGGPVVILEAGSDSQGTNSFPAALIDPIAQVTTVCTYDRLGTGPASGAPPDHPRTIADLVDVLDGALSALELEQPYVLVGQSAGAGIAIGYAAAHPERVAALVPIEGYHDDPTEIAAWLAEEGFTWEDNPEHVDPLPATLEIDALRMPLGEFPVLVISASAADPGGPENQAHWLGLSPNSRQIVIDGPHDLQVTAPEEVARAIVDVVSDLQRG
jgi:pimeloyl-ACP methyl ester carboxylesterase